MLIFTLRRISLFFFTMLLLTILSFSLSFLFPGEQLINLTGQINATPEHLAALAHQYQQQASIVSQYFSYLSHLFQGDMGYSMASQLPITTEIFHRLPATIELTSVALLIAMFFGIPIGFFAAIYHRKVPDNLILAIAMIGYSIPVFWLGMLAILIFSIQLGWLPSAGQISLLFEIEYVTGLQLIDILLSDSEYKWQAFQDATRHLILPVIVVALAPATIFMRLARTAMLEVLDTHYITAAQAKGLTFAQIIYRHAMRNAVIKVIRDVGLQFANLVTIAMITEMIFSWPGIGSWLIESIYQRDYTAIQGGLIVLSTFIFIVHIIIDFVYAALNPLAREPNHGT
ncbi:cationic peptide transport system permease protein [Colwellia chukchiensis]|uniref:Cationic peptide transport system permease protein n=1 Tax=Colwellia chukchiensis TaxID=641665 RepID=A0A1H7GMK2_9GAMM|nr:ABC transporter permease [Colwellia chukchiensis]SEK39386.1 cationic peptide transport system permease protein [Colwellia chukchiensis]